MRLEFCDRKINFGDTLNDWLWSKVINVDFNDNDKSFFLGIGTILTSKRINEIERKGVKQAIIFSSGCWGSEKISLSDKKWKIYGVRGPRTAKLLGLTQDLVIGDGAYLLRNFYSDSDNKGKAIGFIPHHGSELFLNWHDVCEKAGLKYISPQQQPERFIEDLYECQFVITEAMHGAIAADALRIPWKAVKFSPGFSSFKWYDWAEALNIELNIHELPFVISSYISVSRMLEDFVKYHMKNKFSKRQSDRINVYQEKKLSKNNINKLVQSLIDLKVSGFQMSKDDDLNYVMTKLNSTVKNLNNDIVDGNVSTD